jgi:hypothetical protein
VKPCGTRLDQQRPEAPVMHENDTHAKGAEPPHGGRTDHETMRSAAMRRTSGPGGDDALAAIGGVELPGRESHVELIPPDEPVSEPVHEMIPGEYDGTTLTHREAGAMGGQFSGADLPPDGVPVDDVTRDLVEEAAGKTRAR